jgi:hypothetical protein
MVLRHLFLSIIAFIAAVPAAGGPGRFDSVGGTYDKQTGFSFEKTLYYQMRSRSIIGKLSRAGIQGASATDEMNIGGDASLLNTNVITKKKISEGDMVRLTIQEHAKGMPTYGDNPIRRGDYLAYKNLEVRVNEIDSPAIPVPGRMAQQRAAMSIKDIPASVRQEVMDYLEEQIEYEFLYSLLAGASPSLLQTTANGGLGVQLGVNAAGSAGVPLWNRHVYTPQAGYLTYNTTPATWNAAVNTAINGITAGANGRVSLNHLRQIRNRLDAIHFRPPKAMGQKCKALALVDTEMWQRIDSLLYTYYQNAKPREKDNNPIFDLDHILVFQGIYFLAVPNLAKLRPAYNASGLPDLGPGMDQDFRDYTNASLISPIIFLGGRAVFEGFNDSISIKEEKGAFSKGLEIAGTVDEGFIRCEWYAKDGRTGTDAVYNDSCFQALFYEDGPANIA